MTFKYTGMNGLREGTEIPLHELRLDEFSNAAPSPFTVFSLRLTHIPTGMVVTSPSYGAAEQQQVRERLFGKLREDLRLGLDLLNWHGLLDDEQVGGEA